MIETETLHHVCIPVTDLAGAKYFYGEILGLCELERPPFDFPGAWYSLGDRQLHLIIVHTNPPTLRGTTEIDSSDGHFAVRVGSYRQTLEHLQAHNVALLERRRGKAPWPQIFITDPDGNVIELNAEGLD